jgi:hypothetical protein
MIAMWNGEVIAHSTDTIRVERPLLPARQRRPERPDPQRHHLTLLVEGQGHLPPRPRQGRGERRRRLDLPPALAARPADHGYVAFWRGVTVEP